MNDVQARDVLAFMSSYDIIDMEVLGTDGKTATFRGVVWDNNNWNTREFGGVYTYGLKHPVTLVDDLLPPGMAEYIGGHSEVLMECLEAVMYQRDLLRAKN